MRTQEEYTRSLQDLSEKHEKQLNDLKQKEV